MKNKSFLSLAILPLILSSCTGNDNKFKYETLKDEDKASHIEINGKYRNMYQIFPISFADSNGDGKGDLQGIIDKLDYLQSMNYTGLWLCPIHKSSTSHHYDVEDYMSVSGDFGTLTTLDNLVSACHERNMTIILDLVINHTSNKHTWFEDSYAAAKANMVNDPDYKKYNWMSCQGEPQEGYRKVNGNDKIAYEGRFDTTMPDLNLQQVLDDNNGDLATELKKIFKFWLVDHKIDGFRCDAVTTYFTGDIDKNLEFMTWVANACHELKADTYLVGEGNWSTNSMENKKYQTSGFDSYFQFGNSAKNTGYVSQTVVQQNAKAIFNDLSTNRSNANGGIEAPFLSNHDAPRYIGSVQARGVVSNAKFAMGLFQTLAGATFTYYGDEIGMASQSTLADGWYRLPMEWGDKYNTDVSKMSLYGVTPSKIDKEMSYPFGSVADQLADEESLINFVKKANGLRLLYPELARGDAELIENSMTPYAIIKRTYNGSSLYMAVNASYMETWSIDYTPYGEVVNALLARGGDLMKNKDKTLDIPPQSIVFFK